MAKPTREEITETLKVAEKALEIHPEEAFGKIDFTEQNVLALNDQRLSVLYYTILTQYYFSMENYPQAEKFLALAFSNANDNYKEESRLLIVDSYLTSWRGDTKTAIEKAEKAITLAKMAGANTLIMHALGLKASLVSSVGDFQTAMELVKEIYNYLNSAENIAVRSEVYSLMAEVYKNMGDLDSSLNYQLQSLEYRKSHPYTTKKDLVIAYYNLAFNYYDIEDFDTAEKYFELSKSLALEEDDQLSIAYANLGLAEVAVLKKEWNQVISLLKGKVAFFDNIKILGMQLSSRILLATAYVELSELEITEKLINEVNGLLEGRADYSAYAYQLLAVEASYYAAKAKYKIAYEKLASHLLSMTDYYKKDKKKTIEKLAVGMRVSHQEKENEFLIEENKKKAALNVQREQQVKILIGASILLVVLLALVLIVLRNNQKLKTKLSHYAKIDKLTGLLNRGYFEWVAKKYFDEEDWKKFSIALFDVDHFKSINDTFGHDVGDQTLRSIALIAQKNIRENDILARYGGEEFVILFTNTNLDAAAEVMNRIRVSMSQHEFERVQQRKITISAGVAQVNDSDHSLQRIITRADKALYDAKNSGRNRVNIDGKNDADSHSNSQTTELRS